MKYIRLINVFLHVAALLILIIILGSNPIETLMIIPAVIVGIGTYVSAKNLKKEDEDIIKNLMDKIFGPDQSDQNKD